MRDFSESAILTLTLILTVWPSDLQVKGFWSVMAPATKFNKPGSDDSEKPSNNLWVGNLASDVTDSDLMDLFANFGALDSVTSYSSRSYAFLFFKRMEDAKAAKEALQGTLLRGNPIKIEFARPVCFDALFNLTCICLSSSFIL